MLYLHNLVRTRESTVYMIHSTDRIRAVGVLFVRDDGETVTLDAGGSPVTDEKILAEVMDALTSRK